MIAALAAATARMFGPSLVRIGDDSLAPIVERGDLVFATRRFAAPRAGSIVVARADYRLGGFFRPRDRVARIVAAVPGERVTWSLGHVAVRRADGTVGYHLDSLHERLDTGPRSAVVPADHLFLIALRPGRRDSRVRGFVAEREVDFEMRAIVWPPDRRTMLPLLREVRR